MSATGNTGALSPEAAQQQQMMEALRRAGPPYPPQGAVLGGVPNTKVDVPVSAVLIAIFASLAATHMTILQVNRRRGILFIPSGVTFGFCMARITTFAMRIAWAEHPTNASVAIAANVFVSAGVILLFIVNLIYAQRILRGYHPQFGNKPITNRIFTAYYYSIIGVLIMVITATVIMFYTLDPSRIRKCRDIQRFSIVYLLVFAFMPTPIVLLSRFVPSTTLKAKFGNPDRLIHKVFIVLTASILLTISTGFRVGTTFEKPRPRTDPAWYHGKAAFYCFIPMLEIFVVVLYAAARVDKRFYIPKQKKEVQKEEKEIGSVENGKGAKDGELVETEA